MTGGQIIAGTGTMDLAGRVGIIGGIQFKMIGARRDGAEWFLAPAANCPDVVGNVPDGLSVVRVETLADARHAVEEIAAGRGDALPTCEPAEG
jgi:PDZ domain-containing protein